VGSGLSLGDNRGGAANGDILEVLIYDRPLGTSDLNQLTSYLSKKYSFLTFAPVSGTSATSTLNVTLQGISSGETVCFTTDGTLPDIAKAQALIKNNGQPYTGNLPDPTSPSTKLYSTTSGINLTGSCKIEAVGFDAYGNQLTPVISAQYYVGDTNQVGISNAWQIQYFGSVNLNATTINTLSPGGLTYLQDYLLGFNPTVFSTNGDGLSDLQNYQAGISPYATNISGDGLTNAQDIALGINPFISRPPSPPPAPSNGTGPTITILLPLSAVKQ
jgi:hypothetical protein